MSIVTLLKPHLTHFSEEIKLKAQKGDEVKVAGKIISVSIIDETLSMMILDDFIGETRILISDVMHNHYRSIIDVGNFVSVEGYVNIVSRKVGNDLHSEYSVVGYDMNILTL